MNRRSHVYPAELQTAEALAIATRRSLLDAQGPAAPMELSTNTSGQQPPPASTEAGGGGAAAPGDTRVVLPKDTVGLALSGGGIRSATFCLGFLQALARERLLRRIDILSSVSGGGYIAGFLGRFYDRLRITPKLSSDIVESAIANSASSQIHNLRTHAQYIAPSGKADLEEGFGIFLRNFLTLHFVIGTLILGLYGLANALRYGVLNQISVVLPFLGAFGWSDMPMGQFVMGANLHVFWSPWFMLVELMLLLFALPRGISYWLCSQDETEAYSRPALLTMFVLLLSLLWLTVRNGLNLKAFFGALPILIAFPLLEWTWKLVRKRNQALGTGGESIRRLRARTYLSRELGLWLALTGLFLYLALIDTLGHALYEAYRGNGGYIKALGQLGAGLLALLPILRGAADLMANFQSKKPNPSFWTRLLGRPSVSAIMAGLLLAPPLVFVSYVSHASFKGGQPGGLCMGLSLAAFTLGLSAILACSKALPLINRTSLQATYAARLARTFLGASNPFREDSSFDDVIPGDDVDSLRDYRPYEAGGPLHLINVCISQTVDLSSLQNIGHRLGASFACSPLGVSIGPRWHALWAKKKSTIEAIDHMPGTDHPLLGVDGLPPNRVQILPLRDWLSISGAACGPGMGNRTNAALSVLFTLANLRTGYWWDSGLSAADRGTRPDVSFTRRLIWLLANLFQTQSRLLGEALARFVGPWDRLWYLSDGGHFENLGGYELIRRQVPYIILADSGADADYDYDDFANFQQKVRIDFQAEMEPLGKARWDAAVKADLDRLNTKGVGPSDYAAARAEWDRLRGQISLDSTDGGPFELISRPSGDQMPAIKKHAALLRVNYADGSHSLLLYVKSSLSGDESPDVCHYYAENPDFPHQSTADQFFNEEQWESYRHLGEHIGGRLFGAMPEQPGASTVLWLTRLDAALCP